MRLTELPNPSKQATARLYTSLEPWQRDALFKVRDEYGLSDDALVRVGLTLVLGIIATVPEVVMRALLAEARTGGLE